MSRDIVPINERDLFWKDPFFSTTWDEFDKMRTDMMAKSKEFWDNCNKDMANFDDAVRKSHLDMDMGMAPFRPQLPSWAMPDSIKDKWAPMMTKANDEVRITLMILYVLRRGWTKLNYLNRVKIIKVLHTLCNLKVTQDPFSSIRMLQNTLSNCKKF